MAGALAGCGGSSGGSSHETVDVGYTYGFDAGDVGDRVGFARLQRKSGVRFRFHSLGGPSTAVAGLLRGDVDLVTMSYVTVVHAVQEGADLRAVLTANTVPEFILVSRSGIRTAADLRGHRVAYDAPGGDGEVLVLKTLARARVPTSAVTLAGLRDSGTRASALAAGRLDAAELDYPAYEHLLDQGVKVHVLSRLVDFRPRTAQTVWVVTGSYARSHRGLLQRVVGGLLDGYAFDYTAAGRRAWLAEARRDVLASEKPGLAPRVYAFYARIRFWPLRRSPITPAQHERMVRFWLGTGQLDKPISFDAIWDLRFWRHAQG